jgi:hypothetical protein
MGVYSGIAQDNVRVTSGVVQFDELGYTGASYGTVTQETSKATGVTLNTITGRITMHNAQLNNNASVDFILTNSKIKANDVVIVNVAGGGTAGAYLSGVCCVQAGQVRLKLQNISGGNLSEAVQLLFAIVKVG